MDFENKILSREISQFIWEKEKTLGTAESCTGGRIAEAIILMPGASNYFKGSIVSYTNEIKENFLDEGEYLTYFFSGDYINLSKHYKKLKEFIRENNYRVCGNIIELYHIEMHITENKEEYVTEIQIPLEKK